MVMLSDASSVALWAYLMGDRHDVLAKRAITQKTLLCRHDYARRVKSGRVTYGLLMARVA